MDNNFALLIDDLRRSRDISRADFVEDIVSERQYYRFIKGESSLKSESLVKLFTRLELNTSTLINLVTNTHYNGNKELIESYNLLHQNNYKESYEVLSRVDFSEIKNEYYQKMYKLVEIIASYNLNLISKSKAIQDTKEMLDYPKVLNKDALNAIESSALNFISAKLIKEGDNRIASYTYERITNDTSSSLKTLNELLLYSSLAKNLGSIKEYNKALNITKLGIKEYIDASSLNLFESYLYLKALSEKYLDKPEDYKKSLTRLFAQLYAEDNMARFNEYEQLVKKNFNLKISDLITFV